MAKDKVKIAELLDSILVSGSYESAVKAKEVQHWWTHKDEVHYDPGHSSKKDLTNKGTEKKSN